MPSLSATTGVSPRDKLAAHVCGQWGHGMQAQGCAALGPEAWLIHGDPLPPGVKGQSSGPTGQHKAPRPTARGARLWGKQGRGPGATDMATHGDPAGPTATMGSLTHSTLCPAASPAAGRPQLRKGLPSQTTHLPGRLLWLLGKGQFILNRTQNVDRKFQINSLRKLCIYKDCFSTKKRRGDTES